jgi:hypothetical protein
VKTVVVVYEIGRWANKDFVFADVNSYPCQICKVVVVLMGFPKQYANKTGKEAIVGEGGRGHGTEEERLSVVVRPEVRAHIAFDRQVFDRQKSGGQFEAVFVWSEM